MKRGPSGRNLYMGLIEKLDGAEPASDKPWKKLSKKQQSRLHDLRALHRRRTQSVKFQKIAKFVKSVRKKIGVSQERFAGILGVSTITVKRWEFGSGHVPSEQSMKKLKEFGKSKEAVCQVVD